MKLLLIEPIVDLGDAQFPQDGIGERKYIYRLHPFAFYIYLTYFNNYYCVLCEIYAIDIPGYEHIL